MISSPKKTFWPTASPTARASGSAIGLTITAPLAAARTPETGRSDPSAETGGATATPRAVQIISTPSEAASRDVNLAII